MAALVPLAVLSLAASGEIPPVPRPTLSGETEQSLPVSLTVDRDSAGWRIAYRERCSDGSTARGRSSSGGGTPRLRLRADGSFALVRTEPTSVVGGGTGTVRLTLRGRLAGGNASGTWSVRATLRRGSAAPITCTSGSVGWRAARG